MLLDHLVGKQWISEILCLKDDACKGSYYLLQQDISTNQEVHSSQKADIPTSWSSSFDFPLFLLHYQNMLYSKRKKKKKSKNVRKSTASLHRILNIEYDILLITNAVLLDIEVHTHLFMG